jgi:hypothetical protein
MVRLHRAGWVLASGLLLTGCDVVSGIWWTLAIVFGLVGLLVTWVSFVDGEPGVGFFGLLVLLFAFWLSPVLVSEVPWIGPPTAAKLGLPSASEAQPKRTSRIVQAAVPAQPKAQLLETKKQLVAIREKAEKLGPMRDRYQAELSDYERTTRSCSAAAMSTSRPPSYWNAQQSWPTTSAGSPISSKSTTPSASSSTKRCGSWRRSSR